MSTATPDLPQDDDARARRNVIVLIAAQAILGAQMPMIFVVGGLAGQMLAPNPCWATLPISMIVLGSMLSATPMSALMGRFGRRAGFWIGTAAGAAGATIAAYGLSVGSFWVFLLGSLVTGTYMSAQGFYRFAAGDMASDAFRPKAISWVMAGGLASAIIGPQLATATADALPVAFYGTYLAERRRRVPLFLPRHPAPGAGAGRRHARPQPGGVAAPADDPCRDDLRHGQLCADEPCDDLHAARGRRLRL